MVDLDEALARVLERLSPDDEARSTTSDWNTVRVRLAPERWPGESRRRLALALVAAGVATCVPAIALSATLRGWLGFPQPVYAKARLLVSAPLPEARVARLWVSPSTDGGECEFLTITPSNVVAIDPSTGAMRPPTASTRGSSTCTLGATRVPHRALTWSVSPVVAHDASLALVHGHVGATYKAIGVELVWNGGRQRLAFKDGYFIGVARVRNPPFSRLPFTVVAFRSSGRATARSRIPTSFLYTNWKKVEPALRKYRHAHSCLPEPARLWVCKTR